MSRQKKTGTSYLNALLLLLLMMTLFKIGGMGLVMILLTVGIGFGAIFLPWSKEVYLMSNLQNEQKLYSLVKEIDDGASINLLI